MSIRYICDVCESGSETPIDEVVWCTRESDLVFDICEKCVKKMFKPVREYRTEGIIKLEEE